MSKLSGYIFDGYDDENGDIMRSVFPTSDDLPVYIKTASRLSHEEIKDLPDDQFALVMFDGTHKLKKYATVDAGNTAISVLYLLKQAHLLPPDAVKTAARNLIGACEYYNIAVPQQLKMAAAAGVSPVSGKSQSPYSKGAKVNKIQWPIPEGPKESMENPTLGNFDAAWDDVSGRTNAHGTPGSNFSELPAFPQKEKVKAASAEAAREIAGEFNSGAGVKQQSWRESPYFDASGWDPSMAGVPEQKIPERTLLDGQYPIDGYDQVKTATAYFMDNWVNMAPRNRHQYCVKLASRLEELDLSVPEKIQRYGSDTYASDVNSYVEARRSYVHDEYADGLDLLLEKRAHVSPGVFAEALAEFDRMSGLNWYWDGHVADPWYSTFGPSMQKVAEENWKYDHAGVRISEEDLQHLALNAHERLSKSFGADFAKEFCKSPKVVFDSMPDPHKIILARMAMDRHSGTITE